MFGKKIKDWFNASIFNNIERPGQNLTVECGSASAVNTGRFILYAHGIDQVIGVGSVKKRKIDIKHLGIFLKEDTSYHFSCKCTQYRDVYFARPKRGKMIKNILKFF